MWEVDGQVGQVKQVGGLVIEVDAHRKEWTFSKQCYCAGNLNSTKAALQRPTIS